MARLKRIELNSALGNILISNRTALSVICHFALEQLIGEDFRLVGVASVVAFSRVCTYSGSIFFLVLLFLSMLNLTCES